MLRAPGAAVVAYYACELDQRYLAQRSTW